VLRKGLLMILSIVPVHPRRLILAGAVALASLVTGFDAAAATRTPGHAAIASAHPLATAAGHEILEKGGNAFDAAIAVAAALAVVEPSSSGLGGGGFFLLHRSSDDQDVMIDAREKAPGAATRDMFLDKSGKPIAGLSTEGALAAGIPGEPAGLGLLARKYGKLPLKESLAPAIRLAREGFPMYPRLLAGVRFKQKVFTSQPELASAFLANGEVPQIGFIVKQPQLARTLELLAQQGTEAFYQGPLAQRLIAGVRKLGGIWTDQDLAAYRAIERQPIVASYRDARIISASPPSSGGIALVDALHILENYNLGALDSATRKHLIIEAMRRMHRDRAVYLGDSDFVQVPVERLTSRFYADGQATSIRLDRATPSDMLPGIDSGAPGMNTTHFSILDAAGNRVAATITINLWFGAGVIVPDTGVLLNDEMDDFSIKPDTPNAFQLVGGDANSIAPGKRMLSSSTPTFVETPRGIMIAGSPGGSFIIGMVLLATLDFMDGKTAAQIVGAPRYHQQYEPDVVEYESDAFTAAEKASLQQRGHKLQESSRRWGNMEVVTWDYADGKVEAASDPRGDGDGMVY
jgi:gamma-glutamyltranspeptidase/glutathione hydrolase